MASPSTPLHRPSPAGCLPWVVITFISPFGNVLLDTKHAAGGARDSCVTQRECDVFIDLMSEPGQGYLVQGDLKIEVYVDKGVGDEYLKREPIPMDAAQLLGGACSPVSARSKKGGKPNSRKSIVPESISLATQSLKNAGKSAVNGTALFGAQGIDGAPPAPGTDRQLVLYTWLHVEMEPGSEATVTIPAAQLDKGKRGIFKRLVQREVALELQFDDAGSAPTNPLPPKLLPPGRAASAPSRASTVAFADASNATPSVVLPPGTTSAASGAAPGAAPAESRPSLEAPAASDACWCHPATGERRAAGAAASPKGGGNSAALERARNAAASAKTARSAKTAASVASAPAAAEPALAPAADGKQLRFSQGS